MVLIYNLEQQAQALFKSWFDDLEPLRMEKLLILNWERFLGGGSIQKLEDFCKCVLDGTPSSNHSEYWT